MSIKQAITNLNQAGDTIVEVMVVLAVLGMAVGVSYATANRSLLNARQAQESSEATALVQSQIEQLRTKSDIITSGNPNYIYRSGFFCMNGGNLTSGFAGSDATIYTNYPAACITSYYHMSITCTVNGSPCIPGNFNTSDMTFNVRAIWDDVLGEGQDTVTMTYRLYPQ